jgi:uncharacterized protein (UPF0216 family)
VEDRERLADTMLRDEMRRLNAHLPKKRQTVRELLSQESPSVPTVDGNRIVMKMAEIEELSRLLPEAIWDRVKLPLVVLRRTELGAGAFTLLGDSNEEYGLSIVLNGFAGTLDEFKRAENVPVVFYKPEISELLRRFHSLIVIGFGVSQDLAK